MEGHDAQLHEAVAEIRSDVKHLVKGFDEHRGEVQTLHRSQEERLRALEDDRLERGVRDRARSSGWGAAGGIIAAVFAAIIQAFRHQ